MTSQRVTFPGSTGKPLSGWLDTPPGPARASVLFAHCFTCSKDGHAPSRISRGLTERGFAVLRFDFTGLGESAGDFADATFTSNIADLVQAATFLRRRGAAPALLVGHSLGGAAVIAAAEQIPEASAVVTIGAPSDPAHIEHLLAGTAEAIRERGEADVALAGRTFRIRRSFLDDIAAQPQQRRIAGLGRALLILHSPSDTTVGIDNARAIYDAARHPKSFVALDGADHLLTDPADAAYAADILAAWAERYLPSEPAATAPFGGAGEPGIVHVESAREGRYIQRVKAGRHSWLVDEPVGVGGDDAGPTPYDQLLAALGTCTSITLAMYAQRKGWPLHHVAVTLRHDRIHAADCTDCATATGLLTRIRREIALHGPLTADQHEGLLEIADRCPVHRVLTQETVIETTLVEAGT